MSEDQFEQHYQRLNPAQRRAVDLIDGPVMVVAGPGTGKTQVLTLRIANILRQTDTPADAILALTVTNAGAHAMRRRLVSLVGSRAYRIPIHTFHSFANELIRRYPEKFPRIVGAINALPIDQIQILEEAILESELTLLRPYGDQFHYLFPVQQEIDRLKRENVSPDDLRAIVALEQKALESVPDLRHEKGAYAGQIKGKYQVLRTNITKAEELVRLYTAYETKLATRRLYDFGDMLLEVNRALSEDGDFRLQIQEEYQYVLADEHQDANQSQNRLLELLSSFHEHPNLFIVGDEKQAIFQFQGASLDNFNYFKKLFPQAALITLKDNYRSTQLILDAAQSVIGKSQALPAESLSPLVARSERASLPIRVRSFTKPAHELLYLAEEIKSKLAAGVSPEQLAVLYRTNGDALPIIDYFERAGIPFVVRSDSNILEDIEVQKLIVLLRAINGFGDDRLLLEFLHLDFVAVDILEIYALREETTGGSLWQRLRTSRKKKLKSWSQKLERWARLAANQSFLDLYAVVVRESGYLEHVLGLPEAQEVLSKLHALYDEGVALSRSNHHFRLADFIQFLNRLATHHRGIKTRQEAGQSGVELMTAHKSKGLEFDYVYVIGVSDNGWGSRRSPQYFKIPTRAGVPTAADPVEDERRLFYVALTRARLAVALSYSSEGSDGRPLLPSQFIEELDPSRLAWESMAEWEAAVRPERNLIFTPRQYQGASIFDPAYLAGRFREQGLSATGLNNYLRCPLDYLFTNLLRVIQIRNRHTMYGTAIHGTLEDFFNRYREGGEVTVESLLASFERLVQHEAFSERDLAAAQVRGREALAGWFQTWSASPTGGWPRSILNEYKIPGCHLTPDLKLVGKIDKIEFLSPETVQIVDYKTMSPKSRNEILGTTKNSTGDIYRQLVFYKILIEECERGRFKVASAMVDFVEPSESGKFKREAFEIPPADEATVRELLDRVAGEIVSGEFVKRGCGEKDCLGCRLSRMMK